MTLEEAELQFHCERRLLQEWNDQQLGKLVPVDDLNKDRDVVGSLRRLEAIAEQVPELADKIDRLINLTEARLNMPRPK